MGKVSIEQMNKSADNGGQYFSIKANTKAKVRFLYNTINDEVPYQLHEFNVNGKFKTIDCNRSEGDPLDNCKYCAEGNKPKIEVFIPLYDVEAGVIKYWKKSSYFILKTLNPVLQTLPSNQTISGYTFIISRQGSGFNDTVYTITPDMTSPYDGKTREQFGELIDPMNTNMIAKYGTEINEQPQNNQQFESTRRTTEVFN